MHKIGKVASLGVLAATTTWSILAMAAQATFAIDTGVDSRAYTADGDWDVGRTKGECASSSRVTGVSVSTGGLTHSILCEGPLGGNSSYVTVDFALGDRRRDFGTGDWDPGYTKGECGANERVVGLSEDLSGQLSRIQCAHAGSEASCHAVIFSSGDNRGKTTTGEWAAGFYKGECAANESVKGISKTWCGGYPHAILCCRESFPL